MFWIRNRCCLGDRMARSSYRWRELPLLLLLVRPYRCTWCHERHYSFLFWPAAERPRDWRRTFAS